MNQQRDREKIRQRPKNFTGVSGMTGSGESFCMAIEVDVMTALSARPIYRRKKSWARHVTTPATINSKSCNPRCKIDPAEIKKKSAEIVVAQSGDGHLSKKNEL